MLGVSFGSRDVARVCRVLDEGYDSLGDEDKGVVRGYAERVLEVARGVVVERMKFAVVAQLWVDAEHRFVSRGEADASKVCLGFFSTRGDAERAAGSVVSSTSTRETWRSWVVEVSPVGSVVEFHRARRAVLDEAALVARAGSGDAVEAWKLARWAEVQEWLDGLPEGERRAVQRRVDRAVGAAG